MPTRHLWDIKQKTTKKMNKLIDTGNGMNVTRGEKKWWEDKEGKGGQLYGRGGR